MKHSSSIAKLFGQNLVICSLLALVAAEDSRAAAPSGSTDPAEKTAAAVGIHGGLCVQVGGLESSFAAPLAGTGRFLMHMICTDDEQIDKARDSLGARGLYGLATVGGLQRQGKLPFTENLVNLLVVCKADEPPTSLDEAARVLCPDGVLLAADGLFSVDELKAAGLCQVRAIESGGSWLTAKKPRPDEMDQWGHSRHSADGNPVSADTLVDPPRRVRWVVGAMAEVPGIISSSGRNFYGAVLARDSFNGLRLWDHDLLDPKASGPLVMKRIPPDVPAPVAAGQRLFGVSEGKLFAFDAATGETVRHYEAAGSPRQVLYDEGILLAADDTSVRALDAENGKLIWQFNGPGAQCLVAGDDCVGFVYGRPRLGETATLVSLVKTTGDTRWQRDDLPWTGKVRCSVYHRGMLAYEVSTFNNDGPGNSLHVLSADDGKIVWQRDFFPGMNHARQARAMFVEDRLWILHGGRDDQEEKLPTTCLAIDLATGQEQVTHQAGLTHCFPPVATPRYMLAGELDMTDLASGQVDANRITKAACSRDHGWVPANGLIYVTPKHCTCWPMLRGYAALAPARPDGPVEDISIADLGFGPRKGAAPVPVEPEAEPDAWPCYRHDAWRSASTTAPGPSRANTIWSVDLGSAPEGPIAADWLENPFVKGSVSAPVVAGGLVYVARPDEHEVVALDAASGKVRWRFRADGRVDTAPTIDRGLCLFGSRNGSVYCLRADDGRLVWQMQAAPLDERIVAHGQLESPWPVSGSVLVVDDTVFFAAGRQPLADGGIFVFAVEPADGTIRWVERLDSLPQKGFYNNSALEFDTFDLLHREGDAVAMSRWLFNRDDGQMSVDTWRAFAKLDTGGGPAMVPPGCWSYAPRHQQRIPSFTHRRPLLAFRDNQLFSCLQGMRSVFRRDFDLPGGEVFDDKWMTGWAAAAASRDGKMPWRSHRLAEKALWQVDVFDAKPTAPTIDAMVLTPDRLWLASSNAELQAISLTDGKPITTHTLPSPPLWDGMAVAYGRLFVTTADGRVVCLGGEKGNNN